MAADGNPAVQMVLPMAEMVGWLRQGVGELVRQAGFVDAGGSPGTGRRTQPKASGKDGPSVG
jgi:hypothetical protein